MTKTKGLTVQLGKAKLITPDGTVFIYPCFGDSKHANVMVEIDVAGLKRPTFRDTIHLVHAAWQDSNDEKYSQEIINLIKNDWLVADTGILYVPKKGVYIQDHPFADVDGYPVMNEKNLASKLEAKSSVRFTDYNYQTEEQTPEQLAENSFVIALAGGKKEADLVAEIAAEYPSKPYLNTIDKDKISEPITRFTSLGSDDYDSAGLGVVDSGALGFGSDGYAFGIEKTK